MQVGIVYSVIDNQIRQIINPLVVTPALRPDERLILMDQLVYQQFTSVADLVAATAPLAQPP